MKLGKNSEAKTEIERAVALDPSFENGYELAVADLDLGDGEGASKVFSEMLMSFGDTARIHMLFGQAYLGSDFQSKAVDEFKKSIAKNDRLPGAHYLLAPLIWQRRGTRNCRKWKQSCERKSRPRPRMQLLTLRSVTYWQMNMETQIGVLKR